jgi:integrase
MTIDYEQVIKDKRPHLKPTSVRSYGLSLKALAPQDAESMDFLHDVPAVLERLTKYKPTTRKNHLNAAIVVLNGQDSEKAREAFATYEKKRDEYQGEYTNLVKSKKKTASQEANWIEWDEFVAMVGRMQKELKVPRGDEWSPSDKLKFQDYLAMLLYQHYPLRNDFHDMRVISLRELKKLSEAEKREQNFLVREKNGFYLLLNEYKTRRKYGEKRIPIEGEVLKPLRKWLRHNTSGYLLVNRAGQPLSSNGITKLLGRVGQREVGRTLGSSLLRHSYLSHKYGQVNEDKKKDADLMMHSVAMQDNYIKK